MQKVDLVAREHELDLEPHAATSWLFDHAHQELKNLGASDPGAQGWWQPAQVLLLSADD
jgi:hypothetical protein